MISLSHPAAAILVSSLQLCVSSMHHGDTDMTVHSLTLAGSSVASGFLKYSLGELVFTVSEYFQNVEKIKNYI